APPGKNRNLLFGRCFQQLIVLIPNENTMSQFVDKYRRRGAGTPVACPEVIAPGVLSSPRDAYAHAHATSVRKVGGARLAAVELGDQSHDVQAQAEMRLAVGAGARLPERF